MPELMFVGRCKRALLLALVFATSCFADVHGVAQGVLRASKVLGYIDGRVALLPDANTVALENSRIAFVGSFDALPERFASAPLTRLASQTLMAGFVDAHSHFPAVGLGRLGVDLAPPPAGNVATIAELESAVATAAERSSPDQWLLGFDYDESGLVEQRHPTRQALDALVPDRPVWLRHRSGHMGVGNSAALEALGVDEDWQPPEGGVAVRDQDGRLTGLLQETAAPSLARLMNEVPLLRRLNMLRAASRDYLQAGVTTAQNGYSSDGTSLALWLGVRSGVIPMNVVVWPRAGSGQDSALRRVVRKLAAVSQRFTIGAHKLIADGSPQGMTARLTRAYAPTSGRAEAYRGVAVVPDAQLAEQVMRHHVAGHRLAIHANGDAAIDAALDSLESALAFRGDDDHRHMIVHAQTVRDDQLERMARLGVGASFFQNHVLHWGDWHLLRGLGPERAARISPLGSADSAGVVWSLHADSPVTPMRPFELVMVAEDRLTRAGRLLGPAERVERGRALAALTYGPAWQAGLEADRGDIKVGLRADIVALDANPLQIENLDDVSVVGVWIAGKNISLKEPR